MIKKIYKEEFFETEEFEAIEAMEVALPNELEVALDSWKQQRAVERRTGVVTREVNIMEEAHFHYLPHDLQACRLLRLR